MGVLGFGWRKEALRERFYPPEFRGLYDRLQDAIDSSVQPGDTVLDAGCGSGRVFQHRLAGRVRRVVGVDVTKELRENANIDAPERAFAELARVLTPGGRLLALTPNRWHYVPLLARALPHRVHVAFNRRRGVDERDIFPTRYRANTAGRLRELAAGAGLAVERLERFETEPEYLAFHIVPYALGVAYERLVNRVEALAALRVGLLLVARKGSP